MQLFIVRHGDAERGSDGHLTEKGTQQIERLAKYLAAIEVKPIRIITSPLPRAVETAQKLAKELAPEAVDQDQTLACGMQPEDACGLLRENSEEPCIILVGHQPDLGRLCAYLLGLEDVENFLMKKGACAAFILESPARGGGVLRGLVSPSMLP
ncbi:MAG: phosphohistidine phosphatase SixA [Planctomycetes bacterium]|nr:phosphohistidine phosphatase SixA [Planctomycetota bacterium]